MEEQDNRPPVRVWLAMAGLTVIGALALALVTGQWGFLWDSWPVIGLWLALGGIRYIAQVREQAAARTRRTERPRPRLSD